MISEYGRDGWELASVTPISASNPGMTDEIMFMFKRPLLNRYGWKDGIPGGIERPAMASHMLFPISSACFSASVFCISPMSLTSGTISMPLSCQPKYHSVFLYCSITPENTRVSVSPAQTSKAASRMGS